MGFGCTFASLRPLFLLLAATAIATPATAQTVEQGKFTLYKLQQRVGEETYEMTRSGKDVGLKTTFALSFLGSSVPLNATLEMGDQYRPKRFEIKGATSTLTSIDAAVTVQGNTAQVRDRAGTRTEPATGQFFTITHYPPLAIEQALYRYWVRAKKPVTLRLLPKGTVSFSYRGRDTVSAEGRRVALDRYAVDGLVWGSQVAWFDSAQNIIAVVQGDAELDRFEAIRAGYESSMPLFVRRAVADGMNALARASRAIPRVHEGEYAIVNANVIDGKTASPLANAVVLVRDGKIAAVGPAASVALPADVKRFDARGMTVLPGLWDMHGHYEQHEWVFAGLAAGVTTVRDAANELELVTALRDDVNSGRILGPRILAAGVIDGGEHPLGVHVAKSADEARAVVRRYHKAGFVQIKIYQSLPPELVSVVADEAHKLGMTVTGHVPTGMNARQFVEAGADQINHLGFVTAVMRTPAQPGQPPRPVDIASAEAQEAIRFFKQHGTVIDPSLARGEQHAHPKDTTFAAFEPGVAKAPLELQDALNTTGAPADIAPRAMANLERSLRIVAALQDAGIPIVLGTDLVVPGHSIYRELELAVRGGMSPLEAIQAATIVPARAMKLDAESGTIEVGKRADLIVVAGSPLSRISDIRNVRFVVANGKMFNTDPLWRAAGFKP
jgi:imidazolonepropionase-like amidohydrolase